MTARLLVVDDVAANARLLEARLTAEYYEVRSIFEGKTALSVAQKWQPDAVLLDVLMPEMDGYEVCRQLKADQTTAHIPVILVTALSSPRDRREGLICGADEILTKPFEHEIFTARLRGIIRLKRVLDEWRARQATTASLGITSPNTPVQLGGSARALIIDDVFGRAERVRELFAQAQIIADIAEHENEALAHLAAGHYDLITISLSLVKTDPLRLVAKFQSSAATRETGVLLMAQPDQNKLVIEGLNLGAIDCITLPLDEDEFMLRSNNHIQRKRYQDSMRDDVSHALALAVIDPVTKLFNRRYLMNYLDQLEAASNKERFALCMLDIDHFKRINDQYGHSVGDKVLKAVADTLHAQLRKSDLVARYGGEEFVAVIRALPDDAGARAVAEKLRLSVEALSISMNMPITASIGVAIIQSDCSIKDLLVCADAALYDAKQAGRNRISLYNCEKLK